MKKKIALGFAPAKPKLSKMEDVLTFGKHNGKTVEWVLEHAPSYLVWADDNKIVELSEEIYDMAEQYSYEENNENDWAWGIDVYDFMDDD